MSKHIPDARRGEIQYVAPTWPYIIGIDTEHTKRGPESEPNCHPLYDDRIKIPLDDNLVKNILAYGVQEAVKVRKNGTHENGSWVLEVVDGRQRTRACRAAAELAEKTGVLPPRLKIEVIKVDEVRAVATGMMLNELRQDNGVLGKARDSAYALSIGHTEEEVAVIFGVDKQTIVLWQRIIELAPAVQAAIEAGKIAAHAARELSELSHKEQTEKLKELLQSNHKPTAKNIKRITNGAKPKKVKKLFPTPKIRKFADSAYMDNLSPDAQALMKVLAGHDDALDVLDDVPGLAEFLKVDFE